MPRTSVRMLIDERPRAVVEREALAVVVIDTRAPIEDRVLVLDDVGAVTILDGDVEALADDDFREGEDESVIGAELPAGHLNVTGNLHVAHDDARAGDALDLHVSGRRDAFRQRRCWFDTWGFGDGRRFGRR